MARLRFLSSENDVKKLVKTMFDKLGAWSFAPIQNGMGAHGIPDRIACVPVKITEAMVGKTIGVFAAIEAKKPGRRDEALGGATGLQVHQLREIIAAGGYAALVDGQDEIDGLLWFLVAPAIPHTEALNKALNGRTSTNG